MELAVIALAGDGVAALVVGLVVEATGRMTDTILTRESLAVPVKREAIMPVIQEDADTAKKVDLMPTNQREVNKEQSLQC